MRRNKATPGPANESPRLHLEICGRFTRCEPIGMWRNVGHVYNLSVQDKRERWMELAELAAAEQDPDKLIELVREINQLLDAKQDRLNRARIPSKPSE
jgi:hypothetical protein